jgi:Domain of unknown function (DUF4398)
MTLESQLFSTTDRSASSADRGLRFRTAARALLCLAILAAGCAKPPTEARDQAQRAIADARAAGADDYPVGGLSAAEEAFDKGSSAMTERRYRDAEEYFASAVKEAQTVLAKVPEFRETTRRTAEETFALARQDLEQATELLERLEGCEIPGKDPQDAPGILRARLELVRGDVAAGEKMLDDGDFKQAAESASDADGKAGDLVAAFEKALAEHTCP